MCFYVLMNNNFSLVIKCVYLLRIEYELYKDRSVITYLYFSFKE